MNTACAALMRVMPPVTESPMLEFICEVVEVAA